MLVERVLPQACKVWSVSAYLRSRGPIALNEMRISFELTAKDLHDGNGGLVKTIRRMRWRGSVNKFTYDHCSKLCMKHILCVRKTNQPSWPDLKTPAVYNCSIGYNIAAQAPRVRLPSVKRMPATATVLSGARKTAINVTDWCAITEATPHWNIVMKTFSSFITCELLDGNVMLDFF
jgi:hypothetical protein